MKKAIFLLALLFPLISCYAQKHKKETIYLKNGSVLKGRSVRIDDDRMVVRSGRNIWVLNDSQIDTVAPKSLSKSLVFTSPVYFLKTTVGVLAGSSINEQKTPFSFDASFNYRLSPQFYTGLGLGVDLFEESYLPVFLKAEYRLRDTRFSPFASVKGGYMIPLDQKIRTQTYYDIAPYISYWPQNYQETLDNKGGVMFNPEFGFVNFFSNNMGMSLAFGYRFHQSNFEGEKHYKLEKNYNRLSIRLGILFN
ncbi:MAG TPA: hypothetical protein VKA27_12760 [Sunxiuqinia sp.]|nr:hypothetical protein [Sunxiuqinia sp.]